MGRNTSFITKTDVWKGYKQANFNILKSVAEVKNNMNQYAFKNAAYSQQKNKLVEFLDFSSLNIDKTVTEKTPINPICD